MNVLPFFCCSAIALFGVLLIRWSSALEFGDYLPECGGGTVLAVCFVRCCRFNSLFLRVHVTFSAAGGYRCSTVFWCNFSSELTGLVLHYSHVVSGTVPLLRCTEWYLRSAVVFGDYAV